MERRAKVEKILSLTEYEKGLYGGGRSPSQGQMLITGPGPHPERRIGFCVQIRKNCGQFGSDMIFLRHPDGSLVTHENQAFFPMTEEQEVLARTIFTDLPEDEDYSRGYSCCDKVHAVGFLIAHSESKPMPNTPFNIVVESRDPDGEAHKTFISHTG
jgi:hypothetical protein